MLIPYGKHDFIRLVFNNVYALRAKPGNGDKLLKYCHLGRLASATTYDILSLLLRPV